MLQQISKKIFIYLFIYLMLVTITNEKISYDFYKVRKFNITGLDELDTNLLKQNIEIFKNTSIFSINKKDISKIIYSDKTINDFEIIKMYPSTLQIKIKKTNFLAITKKNGRNYYVLENGNLIKTQNQNLKLPYIFGDVDINNFLDLKKIIDSSALGFNEIENFYYFKSTRWDILTKSGLIIKMPINLTVKKINFFFEIIQKQNFDDVKILDFRQENMMITND